MAYYTYDEHYGVIVTPGGTVVARGMKGAEGVLNGLVKEIEDLTPGGSEFLNPHRCIEWIKDRLETTAKIAGERNRYRDALEYVRDEGPYEEYASDLAEKVLTGKTLKQWRDRIGA